MHESWFKRRPPYLPIAALLLIAELAHGQARAQASSAEPSPAGSRAAQASAPRVSPEQLRAALQRYAREPSVRQVVDAVLARAPEPRAAALASRARTAGWVPTLALRARRGQGVDLSHALADEALEFSTDDDLTLEAALTFELDRVVFRSEEVALARQAQSEADARATRVRNAIALYFERRRLQLERDLTPNADPRRALRILELEALLDLLTAGEFTRLLASARAPDTGR